MNFHPYKKKMAQGILFNPTDEERRQVEAMSGYGVPFEQIAVLTRDIDLNTLKKHFKSELIQGKAKANSKIGQTLFQKATGGDTTAMIWWSKTQMGWHETKEIIVEEKRDDQIRKFEFIDDDGLDDDDDED
jgi:hypothetical protein